MKRLMLSVGLITAIVIAMGAAGSPSEKKLPGEFKNLKILPQNISKDSLHAVMRSYSFALGVRCGFCHASNKDTTQHGLDFASDEKEEKNTAREMMTMVHTLNTVNFNYMKSTKPDTIHTIICYTCHRGMKDPSSANLMPEIKKAEDEQMQQWKQQHPGGGK